MIGMLNSCSCNEKERDNHLRMHSINNGQKVNMTEMYAGGEPETGIQLGVV